MTQLKFTDQIPSVDFRGLNWVYTSNYVCDSPRHLTEGFIQSV